MPEEIRKNHGELKKSYSILFLGVINPVSGIPGYTAILVLGLILSGYKAIPRQIRKLKK